MSFSAEVKAELTAVRASGCCQLAECYGMLLCGHTFSDRSISLLTEQEVVASHLVRLLRLCFDVRADLTERGKQRKLYSVAVGNPADRKKIRIALGVLHAPGGFNREIVRRECCAGAFLRGAFLSCGSINAPQKGYHASFLAGSQAVADALEAVLSERHMQARRSVHGKSYVLYFKESDRIEDLLTVMNATNHTLALMHVKIYKDVRNKINRIKNCETANISKTVDAAIEQRLAIETLENTGRLSSLPPELSAAARLRLENPEASLSELVALSTTPITRSGLNHRLRRLVALANEQKNGN